VLNCFFCQVNSITEALPYNSSASFTITNQGFMPADGIVGPTVMFDGKDYTIIKVPSDYKSHTCGICGNFNDNLADDLATKNGTDVSGSTDLGRTIGDSWVLDS
jgi:von Willebrand factor type D domain